MMALSLSASGSVILTKSASQLSEIFIVCTNFNAEIVQVLRCFGKVLWGFLELRKVCKTLFCHFDRSPRSGLSELDFVRQ